MIISPQIATVCGDFPIGTKNQPQVKPIFANGAFTTQEDLL